MMAMYPGYASRCLLAVFPILARFASLSSDATCACTLSAWYTRLVKFTGGVLSYHSATAQQGPMETKLPGWDGLHG